MARVTRVAGRLAALSGEGALDVAERARALERSGRRVAHLELGEASFATPPHVVEAAIRALGEGETRYGPPAGIAALREAIAAWEGERGIAAEPDEILVTPGAKPMLLYAAMALFEPGDEVLVPDPGFPIYPSVVRFAGARAVPYAPDAAGLAARITPRTRGLILNSPHNPTGTTLGASVLEGLAELAERHDLWVVSDEIYARLHYADAAPAPSIAALPGMRARTVVVDGFSKAFAMTGWRLGFGILPGPLVERLTTLAVNGHTCTPAFVQRAGLAALTGSRAAAEAMRAELHRRRDLLVGGLQRIAGVRCAAPAGAFYAFPDVSALALAAGVDAVGLAGRLLDDHGVAALAGSAFGPGGEGRLRLCFAASPGDIALALDGIRECASALALATLSGGSRS